MTKATLPALAAELRAAFPEIDNRIVPVADMQIDKDNLPSLPICFLAMTKIVPAKDRNTPRKPALEENFIIEFWFPPERYNSDRKELPVWAFYDYDTLQERVLTVTSNWISPRQSYVIWKSTTVDANQYAVATTFSFTHSFFHCDYEPPEDCTPKEPDDGLPFLISTSISRKG